MRMSIPFLPGELSDSEMVVDYTSCSGILSTGPDQHTVISTRKAEAGGLQVWGLTWVTQSFQG